MADVNDVDFRNEKKRVFELKLNGLQEIFNKVVDKKSTSLRERDNFRDLKNDILGLFEEVLRMSMPAKSVDCETSGDLEQVLFDLKNEFSSFKKDIYDKVEYISSNISLGVRTSKVESSVNQSQALRSPLPFKGDHGQLVNVNKSDNTLDYATVLKNDLLVRTVKDNDLTKNKKYKAKRIINGVRSDTGLKTVSKLPNRKFVFVSRLNPDTSISEISRYLKVLNMDSFQCLRLKTRFSTYASFHIEVFESDFEKLMNPDVWPDGCLVTEFFGKLREDKVLRESSDNLEPGVFSQMGKSDSSNWLSLFYQNVRGLRTKISDFYSSVVSENYDIICVTESWLCSDIDSSDLFDDRYCVFRRDRDASTSFHKRGGVLIAYRKCFSVYEIVDPDLGIECLWISINLQCLKKMLLCIVYFPPGSCNDLYAKFFDYFERFNSYDNIFICGDFNLPVMNHFTDNNYFNSNVCLLSNFMCLYNLSQYNNVPNNNYKYLDLILSTVNCNSISVKHCDNPLVPEDSYHYK